LEPGQDICLHTKTNPIQNKIFDFAIEMKNIIYIIADLETRKCVVIDAVSRFYMFYMFYEKLYILLIHLLI
jgi:hypothetical protein